MFDTNTVYFDTLSPSLGIFLNHFSSKVLSVENLKQVT